MTRARGELTRNCPRCGKEILYATFQTCYEANKNGTWCLSCSHLPKHKRVSIKEGFKFCNKCQLEKEVKDFNKDAYNSDGLSTWCAACMRTKEKKRSPESKRTRSEYSKEWYQRTKPLRLAQAKEYRDTHKPLMRLSNFKQHYDLTQEQLDYIIAWKEGKCAACGVALVEVGQGTDRGVVDHDHSNDKFRAILCYPCNHVLGHAKDNPETLRKCAEYLEKWKQNENWLDFANPDVLQSIQRTKEETNG